MTALQVAESTAERSELILQPDAVDFLAELHGTFDQRRRDLLAARLEMVAIRAELGEAQWTASHFAAAAPSGRVAECARAI